MFLIGSVVNIVITLLPQEEVTPPSTEAETAQEVGSSEDQKNVAADYLIWAKSAYKTSSNSKSQQARNADDETESSLLPDSAQQDRKLLTLRFWRQATPTPQANLHS